MDDELTELPEPWVSLADKRGYKARKRANVDAAKWIRKHGTGKPCSVMRKTIDYWLSEIWDREDVHPPGLKAVHAIIGDVLAGHKGGYSALDQLRIEWLEAADQSGRRGLGEPEAEWRRMCQDEIRKVANEKVKPPCECQDKEAPKRQLRFVPASTIEPKRASWLLKTPSLMIPDVGLTLTPGRRGIGKSLFHVWLIARITRGALPGIYKGTPRPVAMAATEDDLERILVPRLMAAEADLDLVHFIQVERTEESGAVQVSLPADVGQLKELITEYEIVMVSLDPVLEFLHGSLNANNAQNVRQALTPLTTMASETGISIVGNAHFIKSSGSDPLTLISSSSAFSEVCRSAIGLARDRDGSHVIAQLKNNWGLDTLPDKKYKVKPVVIDMPWGPDTLPRFMLSKEPPIRTVREILADDSKVEEEDSPVTRIFDILSEQPYELSKTKLLEAIGDTKKARAIFDDLADRGIIMSKPGAKSTKGGRPAEVWAVKANVENVEG